MDKERRHGRAEIMAVQLKDIPGRCLELNNTHSRRRKDSGNMVKTLS